MKRTNWKEVAELVGITAVVGSLIFVGLQVQQDRSVALAQLYADHDDTQIEWARLISENNDVWVRGLKNEELSNLDSSIFFALAGAYFNKEANRYSRAILISGIPPEGISIRFANNIHSYPGLDLAWMRQDWVRNKVQHQDTPFGLFVEEVNVLLGEFETGHRVHDKQDTFAPM